MKEKILANNWIEQMKEWGLSFKEMLKVIEITKEKIEN